MKTLKISVVLAISAIVIGLLLSNIIPHQFFTEKMMLGGTIVYFVMLYAAKKFQRIQYGKEYAYWGPALEGKIYLTTYTKRNKGLRSKSLEYPNPGNKIDITKLTVGRVYSFRKSGEDIESIQLVHDAFASAAGIDCPVRASL